MDSSTATELCQKHFGWYEGTCSYLEQQIFTKHPRFREWFQRLFSYFPGIQFTVHHVIVQGWLWDTLVATRLSVTAPRADGSMYQNEAMQFLRLQWGRVVEDQLYEDTYKLVGELQQRLSREETDGIDLIVTKLG